MRFYYQYDILTVIYARVKSALKPIFTRQVVVDKPLREGPKRYVASTGEVVYYKNEYDEDGEYVRTVEDTDEPRTEIPSEDRG